MLEDSLWPAAGEEQEKRRVKDPWEDILKDMPEEVTILLPPKKKKNGQGDTPDDDEESKTLQIIYYDDVNKPTLEMVKSADVLTYVLRKPAERQTTWDGMRLANLSITHNSCADRGAQPDIGETGQAAPHHDVPRRRIIGAREVSA